MDSETRWCRVHATSVTRQAARRGPGCRLAARYLELATCSPSGANPSDMIFRWNHPSSYLPIGGRRRAIARPLSSRSMRFSAARCRTERSACGDFVKGPRRKGDRRVPTPTVRSVSMKPASVALPRELLRSSARSPSSGPLRGERGGQRQSPDTARHPRGSACRLWRLNPQGLSRRRS